MAVPENVESDLTGMRIEEKITVNATKAEPIQTITTMPTDESDECAHCHQLTTKYCSGCNDAPSYISDHPPKRTFFCSSECQTMGWKDHKVLCNRLSLRKKLQRIAWMIDTAWHTYREKAFDVSITNVQVEGNMLVIYEDGYTDWFIKYRSYCWPFPTSVAVNDQDKRAVLDFMCCGDAIAYMQELIVCLLKGT